MLSAVQGKGKLVSSQQASPTAVALAVADGEPTAYFVGHSAALKIHTLSTNAQVSAHRTLSRNLDVFKLFGMYVVDVLSTLLMKKQLPLLTGSSVACVTVCKVQIVGASGCQHS